MGVYLVDTWCVGVKDTTWLFNVAKEEIDDLMSQMGAMLPEEITYDEAHNWIYGALAFAEEVGIKPHQDFAVAQYILEEDDDNIPLIEYEFGRNGRYCLVSHGTLEASHYRPALNKHLGPDGYDLIVNNSPHPYADRYDYNSDEDESMDFFKEYRDLPRMKHTYTGKDYPKDIILHHPEIEPIVSKDMETITDEEIHSVLNLPADTLREDLHNLVLRELYRQTIKGKDNRRKKWQIIGNAFMFLVKVGNVESTLPIVLEVLRQDEDVITYNFGDFASCLLTPLVITLCKGCPSLLTDYLLEEGPDPLAKILIFETLPFIGHYFPDTRDELVDMYWLLLSSYTADLPTRSICDGEVTSFLIFAVAQLKAKELLPQIKQAFDTDLIYTGLMGHYPDVVEFMDESHPFAPLPPMEPIALRDHYDRATASCR